MNGQGNTSVLDRLRKAGDAARPLLDQINKGLAEAEKRLRACQPVTSVWTSYRDEPEDPTCPDACHYIHYCIGLAKHEDEWRLCCGSTHDGYPELDVAGIEPVTQKSRSERIEVADCLAKWLPELQERMAKEAEDLVSRAKNALVKMTAGLGQI
jgi:hypothetical protein